MGQWRSRQLGATWRTSVCVCIAGVASKREREALEGEEAASVGAYADAAADMGA